MNKFLIVILGSLYSTTAMAIPFDDIDKWAMVTVGKEDPYYIMPKEFLIQNSADRKTPHSFEKFNFRNGENASNWEQRMHLMATNGKPDPNGNSVEVTKDLIADGIRKNCPNDYFQIQKESVKDKKLAVLMGCRNLVANPHFGLVSYHFFIEGKDSMYVVAREAKVGSFESIPFSDAELEIWKAHLERTVICAKDDFCIHKKNASTVEDTKSTPQINTFLIKLGQSADEVRNILKTQFELIPYNSPDPKNAYQLNLKDEGIIVFFDKEKKVTLIRLTRPFTGKLKDVAIGDSFSVLQQKFGSDLTKSFRFGSNQVYFYRPSDGSSTRFDVNPLGNIETIFILKT